MRNLSITHKIFILSATLTGLLITSCVIFYMQNNAQRISLYGSVAGDFKKLGTISLLSRRLHTLHTRVSKDVNRAIFGDINGEERR